MGDAASYKLVGRRKETNYNFNQHEGMRNTSYNVFNIEHSHNDFIQMKAEIILRIDVL